MSNKTFLRQRLEEAGKPFVVSHIDDTIYDVEWGKDSSDFLEIEEARFPLVSFAGICGKENEAVEYEDVDKRRADIQRQFDDLQRKKAERETKDDQLLLFNFISYAFANYINLSGEEILPNDETALLSCVDAKKFQLNAGESLSVMSRKLLAGISRLFIRGRCFRLVEKPGLSPAKERVSLRGKNLWPEFECTAEEFDKKYAAQMNTAFESRIKEFYQAELAKLSAQQARHSEIEQMLSAKSKENKDGVIGFAKVDGLYYLYMHHRGTEKDKGYYSIRYTEKRKSYGWFPPLALGLNIIAESGKLKFKVQAADRKNIRILSPVPYEHPAVLTYAKPDLCLRVGGYGYPGDDAPHTWGERKKFLDAIRAIFNQAAEAIQTGFLDAGYGYSAPYHGGLTGADFKKYEDCKMPIGWADKTLKWGF